MHVSQEKMATTKLEVAGNVNSCRHSCSEVCFLQFSDRPSAVPTMVYRYRKNIETSISSIRLSLNFLTVKNVEGSANSLLEYIDLRTTILPKGSD